MNTNILKYSSIFILPFILSLIFTPLVRRLAFKIGLVSYPRTNRWHRNPTALLGGVGIYLAALISTFFLRIQIKEILGLFTGATFLFFVGLIDDKFHLKPYTKLFLQIIAGGIAISFGVVIGSPWMNILFAIPLTLLWIVVITNAFNLLDNIDGLAVGTAAISLLMLFLSSLIFSNNPLGIFGLILCGAALGFLPYNFNPAKIFMGDSGSMFLGYSLAVISISGTSRYITHLLAIILIPVLILCVPIFDTIFVMIVRKIQGKRIFEGGKDHTSHRLVSLGLSPKKTVLLLYLISIIFGTIAISYSKLDAFIISIIAFLAVAVLLFFGIFLFEITSYGAEPKNSFKPQKIKNGNLILNNILLYKRRVVEVLLDFGLICVAYYAAYFLRFEDSLLTSNIYLIKQSLVWIILIKISTFFIFGLYRGVWRYVSVSDFLTIFKVVTFSSIISVLFLTFTFRFQDYSRAVFFIDWLVLLFLIMGSRFLFRILDEFFSRVREEGKNVLIFGAGDTGEMVMREIKRNKALNYNPVGFIDDDPSKIGNKIQGVPVLGSRDELKYLIQLEKIEEVIIAIHSLEIADITQIGKICNDCNVSYRRVKGILDKEEIINAFGEN